MVGPWTCTDSLTPDQRLDVLHLLNRTEVRLGREAIDEGRQRIVVHGWPGEHWLHDGANALDGYALLTGSNPSTLEMCGGGFDAGLLSAVLASHANLHWWTRGVHDVTPGHVIRTLEMLEVGLPVDVVPVPAGATLRNFEPGRDEQSWLAQNNAAFAHHPEQGAWREEDLDERCREPWFDPSGFLLLEIDGRLAASCWTKVHELHPDRFGEIYVISVHPDFQGRNLGRVMVTQGLEVLRRKGVTEAILFVDQSNIGARHLYASLGFTMVREDQLVSFEAT